MLETQETLSAESAALGWAFASVAVRRLVPARGINRTL
jgi:hypothetical protein